MATKKNKQNDALENLIKKSAARNEERKARRAEKLAQKVALKSLVSAKTP